MEIRVGGHGDSIIGPCCHSTLPAEAIITQFLKSHVAEIKRRHKDPDTEIKK